MPCQKEFIENIPSHLATHADVIRWLGSWFTSEDLSNSYDI